MDVARACGLVLRELREELGISQVELSERAGYDRSYIGRVERGENSPTITTVFVLAETLGASPVDVVKKIERLRKKS